MPNPWLKKNPFLSIWLSTANRLAGSYRAQAVAQAKRATNAAVTEAANESIRAWVTALTPQPARKKPTRKR